MPMINFWAVLVCGIVSMILGMIWYGPWVCGNAYMKLMGVDPKDTKKIKESQKGMGVLYFGQFLLTLLQVYILANVAVFGQNYFHISPLEANLRAAFALWLGFVVPLNG